jgi:hypothetical protein
MFGMPQLFAPAHIDVAAATGNLISAPLYVVFGYFTSRRWRLALAIPVLESGYSMITVSLRSGSQLVFLAVMLLSITVAKVLIHGFIAIGEEARTARLPSLTAESRTRAA